MKTAPMLMGSVMLCSALLVAACDDEDDDDRHTTTTTTTTTTSSTVEEPITTTTTTTSLPVTTTTRDIPVQAVCGIVWSVMNDVSLGALQFETVYTAARGVLRGSGDQVECVNRTDAIATFNDDNASDTLSAGFISIDGLGGPLPVMDCTMELDVGVGVQPDPDDFLVTVVDATDPELNPVAADVAVTAITCSPIGTTTTTSSMTTIIDESFYTVAFSLDDAVTVGALQIEVGYAGAPGEFDGADDTVTCRDRTGSLASFNDQEGTETLSAGFISLSGFTGPRLLAECSFTAAAGTPVPADFAVTVVDAAAPNLTPINPVPTISVAVSPQ